MKKIIWNDQFSVRVRTMDDQHQNIIYLFNKLVDNVEAKAGSETVSDVLAEMVEYASEHFDTEEKLLSDHAYPYLQQQINEHREFRQQAGKFCLLASQGDEKMTHDLVNYLHDWWTNHILVEDKKYAALVGDTGKFD